MGKVIGALVGLIATAAYAVAAAELLAGETGVDLLAGLRPLLPEPVAVWLARAPLGAVEGAPMWRAPIMAVAIAAGAAGGLFLIVTSRLAAVTLWLAFLLLVGLLLGQDVAVAGAWPLLTDPAARPELYARLGVLGLALLFALIAHVVTGRRAPEAAPEHIEPPLNHVLKEKLRAPPIGLEDDDRPLAPPPATPRQSQRRARSLEEDLEPTPRRARSLEDDLPPSPAARPVRQAAAVPAPAPVAQPPAPEARRERDLDRTRPPEPEPTPTPAPEPDPQAQVEREAEAEEELEPAKG